MTLAGRARRRVVSALAVVSLAAVAACDPKPTPTAPVIDVSNGRLTARVTAPTATVDTGLQVLTIAPGGRPFGLYVPSNYTPTRQWPMTVLLHGNGSSGEEMAFQFQSYANTAGVVVLAPNSAQVTWDLILNLNFGNDLIFIDNLLKWAFVRVNVDPNRLSISGFDDGATYALWLGLKNGDLFTRIAAFTPCSSVPDVRTGLPALFISHSTDDTVAPIAVCTRPAVPILQADGYTVQYVEYTSGQGNGHFITPDVITQGMTFLAK